MISTSNVTLRVGKKALFEDVNIKFTEGNCYGLIGANGAGKSTFLKILSGQLEPTNGEVIITPGERLSFLQQDHFKYDEYPVLDTVMMGNARLYEIMKEKEAIYAKEDFTDEDGMKASELEGEFAAMNGWASVLGCNLGMFYKRRDYSRIVNGRNPIVAHEYLGESVEGKDVFIADDIIASGESMLDIAYELKMRGARNIFTCCTFPLFTAGLEKFDKAYNDGIIKAVLGTNLTYRKPELLEREWYYDVDVSKYTAYFIAAINHDKSVSSIIDPMAKIRALLDKHGIPMGGEQ